MQTAPESLVKVRDNFKSIAEPLTAIDRADDAINEAAGASAQSETTVKETSESSYSDQMTITTLKPGDDTQRGVADMAKSL